MRIFVIAAAVTACSSVAFAGEVTQDKKAPAPIVKAQTLSDAQMDKVTAGDAGGIPNYGSGSNGNAYGAGVGYLNLTGKGAANGNGRFSQ